MLKLIEVLMLLFIILTKNHLIPNKNVEGSYISKYHTDCPFKKIFIQTSNSSLQNLDLVNITTIKDKNTENEYGTNDLDYYKCPGNNYEKNFQLCCLDSNKCCPLPEQRNLFHNFSSLDDLPFWISFLIILVFVLTFFGFFVCCFWSICPLYNSCRIRYYKDEAGCADKMGETQTNFSAMPIEETKIQNTVVITKKFDSDSLEQNSQLRKDVKNSVINPTTFV